MQESPQQPSESREQQQELPEHEEGAIAECQQEPASIEQQEEEK